MLTEDDLKLPAVESTITQRVTWIVAYGESEELCNDREHAVGLARMKRTYDGRDNIEIYRTTELITRTQVEIPE